MSGASKNANAEEFPENKIYHSGERRNLRFSSEWKRKNWQIRRYAFVFGGVRIFAQFLCITLFINAVSSPDSAPSVFLLQD